MKIILKAILVITFALIGYSNSYAQTLAEIEKNADELFEKEAYLEAGKLYLKIISDPQRRKDHDLNFKYGTCLLHGKGPQKEESIKFLSYSVKKPSVDKRAYYFLGVAYQYNYQFDNAIKQYKRFKKNASSAQLKKYKVDVDINSCNNGKRLLSNVTDMIVIKKTNVKAEDFYQLYKTNNIGGNILIYDEFQTKFDKKMGHRPVIHFPKNSPYVYYSSYGNDGATGLDIYVVKKLPNNKWSLPQKVVGGVNTFQDENYPYMNPNGNYLYFSSKGHNSMGGYDVFRSKYNSDDNSFSKPENMDFAISSPDDDIFYIVDSLDRQAYFASARESEQGKLTVYNVRVEKIPMQLAVIKGDFVNEILASNRIIEVIVTDFSSGNEIGTFKSKSRDGGILMTFPKSGRYNFIMTVEGEPITHQAVITIPYLKEFRPLKMRIKHQNDANGEHILTVEQLFDERFENPTAVLAEVYKEMSKLPPNSTQFNIDSLDQIRGTDEVFVDAGLDPFVTKDDIEKVIADKIIELDKIIEGSQENGYIAYHLADENLKSAQKKLDEANDLLAKANQTNDKIQKRELLEKVFVLNESAKKDKTKADEFISLGEELTREVEKYNGQLLEAKKAELDIKTTNADDRVALANAVKLNSKFYNNQIKNPQSGNVLDNIANKGHSAQKEYSKLNSELLALEKQKAQLQKSNKQLTSTLENTKKKKEINRIKDKIASNNSEIGVLTDVISKKQNKLNGLDKASSNSIDLTRVANKVQDPKYKTDAYTKAMHPNDILKIKNAVKTSSINSDIELIDESLANNNVNGKYVSLTGLDESRTDFTEKQWASAYDKEIEAQQKLLASTKNTAEKQKIQQNIERLEKAKSQKVGNSLAIDHKGDSDFFKGELIDAYKQKYDKIGKIISERERREAENQLNSEVISAANLKIDALNKDLKNDPNNTNIKEEIKAYNNIINDANQSIKNNNAWLSKGDELTNNNLNNFVSKSFPAYQNKLNTIESSPRTFDEKQKDIEILNQTTLANVEEQIQEKNAQLQNDPNNTTLKNEINQLNKIKNSIENNPKQPLINSTQITDVSAISAKVNYNDLYPGYQIKIDDINNNSAIDEIEKAKQKLSIDKTILNRINNQVTELETALNKKPKNSKTISKRIKNLKALKNDVQQKINKNETIIKAGSVTQTNPNIVADVSSINPLYDNKKATIKANNNKDEQATAIIDLNQQTILKIDDRIAAINSELVTKPNNYDLLQEKVSLNNLRNQLQNEIDENTKTDFSNVSATVVAEDIIPGFYQKLDNIDKSLNSNKVKAQNRVVLHQQLVDKIDIQITKLNEYLGSGPENDKTINKRIKNLEKLRANSEYEIALNLKKIDAIANNNPNAVFDANKINPNYNTDIAKANAIENDTDKKEAIDEINKKTIKKINSKIREIKLELKSNPDVSNAEELKQKQVELTNLKNKLQAQIDGTNSPNYIDVISSVTPNDLLVDYDSKMTTINNSNNQKEVNAKNRITLNKQLISQIDLDLAKMQTYLATSPSNSKTVEKRIKNLLTLKSKTQNNIVTDQNSIEKSTNTDQANNYIDVISSVTPNDLLVDYDSKMTTINNSNNQKEVNAKNRITLNKQLISQIDIDLTKMQTYLATNPSNSKTVEKRIKNLLTLKSKTQNNIVTDQNSIEKSTNTEQANTAVIANVNDVLPEYNYRYAKIKEIEIEDKKNEAIKKLNNEVIAKIDVQISNLKSQLNNSPSNTSIANKIVELENLKTKLQTENKKLSNAMVYNYKSINTNVNKDNLLPNYTAKLEKIKLKDITDEEQAIEITNLNNTLINKIDSEIKGLNSYLTTNPSNKKDAEKRLKNLNSTKTSLLKDNAKYAKVKNNNSSLSPITINTLMPDYENKVLETKNNTNLSETEKLTQINKLNNTLISKIDLKTTELIQIKKSSNNKNKIEEQILKLNELKEVKLAEIETNNQNLNNITAQTNLQQIKTAQVKNITTNDYTTDEAKNIVENHSKDFENIETLDKKTADLELQKQNAQTEKAKAKIDKKINKNAIVKAKIENEIIQDLATATKKENQIKTANVISVKNNVKSLGTNYNSELKEADNELNIAQTKFDAAQVLRNEAKNQKDPVIANEKLKSALVLEKEANQLIKKSSRTYKTAIVINQINKTDNVIVSVDENEENRTSTKMFNTVKELDKQARYYDNRAIELADSSTTVKKKYKNAILIEAQKATDKANELKAQSNKLKTKAEKIKEQEDEILASTPNKSTNTTLTNQADIDKIVTTDTYETYFEAKSKGDENMQQAKLIEQEIKAKKAATKRIIKQAIVIEDGEINQNKINNNSDIKKLQNEIAALTKQQQDYKNKALYNYKSANEIIANTDLNDQTKNEIIALTNTNVQPKEKTIAPDATNPLMADFTPPTKLNQNIYRTTNVPVYNNISEIPVDAVQPTGLVYKVQIGAFRRQPAKTYFDKFAPVSGQTLNNGITRYMVGYFTAFTPANTVKNQVRGMGDYKDAFVVAYYNGQKISMAKAKQIEAGQEVPNLPQPNTNNNTNNTIANNNNQTNNSQSNNNQTNNNQTTNTTNQNNQTTTTTTDNQGNITVQPTTQAQIEKTTYYTSTPNAAKANQVEIMNGLFYTVQIGVYSKPVKASVLYNITPLNSQLTTTNKIRYTTGIFNSVAEANVIKNQVIAKGITDAFVTVYYNGKRITVAKGNQILNTNGKSILFTKGANTNTTNTNQQTTNNNNNNQTPNNSTNTNQQTSNNNNNQTQNNSTNTNQTQNTQTYTAQNIKYRLLIGTFQNKVPNKYANFLFNTEGVEFETKTTPDGTIYLYTTPQNNINQIKQSLVEVSELGIEDMKIISYYNNDVIPFEQAKSITNNTQNTPLNTTNKIQGINADFLLYQPEAVYYKIEAKFKNEVPINLAEIILSLDQDSFTDEIDEDGNTIYASNNINTYKEAQNQLEFYHQKGFTNAQLIAYHKYQKISVNKARAIKGE